MRRILLITLACSSLTLAAAAPPDEPPRSDDQRELRRELRIGAEVFRSALAENLANDRRALQVEAGYLAGQGVLLLVELTRPWFLGPNVEVNPEIAHLEQIPEMVQDILAQLNIGLAPQQAEDFRELREIRSAQREVRGEQRELRAQIRETRRRLRRADGAEANRLREQIDELNRDLAAAKAEEQTLEAEAARARASLGEASRDDDRPARLDQAVARTVCAYGATFRSPADDEHLNVVVRSSGSSRYYTFRLADTRRCQAGALNAESLLQRADVREL